MHVLSLHRAKKIFFKIASLQIVIAHACLLDTRIIFHLIHADAFTPCCTVKLHNTDYKQTTQVHKLSATQKKQKLKQWHTIFATN